jgi:hypothetical protein
LGNVIWCALLRADFLHEREGEEPTAPNHAAIFFGRRSVPTAILLQWTIRAFRILPPLMEKENQL